MCFGDPAKSLALAHSRLTPEQWAKFEREFDDFCVVQGLTERKGRPRSRYMWAKWAFFQGRQHAHRWNAPALDEAGMKMLVEGDGNEVL